MVGEAENHFGARFTEASRGTGLNFQQALYYVLMTVASKCLLPLTASTPAAPIQEPVDKDSAAQYIAEAWRDANWPDGLHSITFNIGARKTTSSRMLQYSWDPSGNKGLFSVDSSPPHYETS